MPKSGRDASGSCDGTKRRKKQGGDGGDGGGAGKSSAYGPVVIANTHLVYNPKRGDVKLAQLSMLLSRVEEQTSLFACPCLLVGDFNATPASPIYSLLDRGRLNVTGLDRRALSGQEGSPVDRASTIVDLSDQGRGRWQGKGRGRGRGRGGYIPERPPMAVRGEEGIESLRHMGHGTRGGRFNEYEMLRHGAKWQLPWQLPRGDVEEGVATDHQTNRKEVEVVLTEEGGEIEKQGEVSREHFEWLAAEEREVKDIYEDEEGEECNDNASRIDARLHVSATEEICGLWDGQTQSNLLGPR